MSSAFPIQRNCLLLTGPSHTDSDEPRARAQGVLLSGLAKAKRRNTSQLVKTLDGRNKIKNLKSNNRLIYPMEKRVGVYMANFYYLSRGLLSMTSPVTGTPGRDALLGPCGHPLDSSVHKCLLRRGLWGRNYGVGCGERQPRRAEMAKSSCPQCWWSSEGSGRVTCVE